MLIDLTQSAESISDQMQRAIRNCVALLKLEHPEANLYDYRFVTHEGGHVMVIDLIPSERYEKGQQN